MNNFTITQDQIQAMSNGFAQAFVMRCRSFLRENFERLNAEDDQQLDARTRAAIEFGKRLNFRKEISVQRFLVLQQQFNFSSETNIPHDHMAAITAEIDEGVRLDHLEYLLSDEHIR